MQGKIYVAVIGSSTPIPDEVREAAEKVGELLARNGAIIICGGRGGVMEAVCRGAKKANGVTVGILPGFTREEANRYIDIAIPTGIGFARNAINVLAADTVIAIHGGPGTLSEIGLALAYGKPVILLRGLGGASDFEADLGEYNRLTHEAKTPEEAVEKALKLAKQQ